MVEGNIKIMEVYLYLKMPIIFTDRDLLLQKKCWIDYNGNKAHVLYYIKDIEHPDYLRKEKSIRGSLKRGGYIKSLNENQCQMYMVSSIDVKLSIGFSILSKKGAEEEEKWIKKLKKQLEKC